LKCLQRNTPGLGCQWLTQAGAVPSGFELAGEVHFCPSFGIQRWEVGREEIEFWAPGCRLIIWAIPFFRARDSCFPPYFRPQPLARKR
jgi:hypothetical protein